MDLYDDNFEYHMKYPITRLVTECFQNPADELLEPVTVWSEFWCQDTVDGITFPKQGPKTELSLLQNAFHFVGRVWVRASSKGPPSLLHSVSGILIRTINSVQRKQIGFCFNYWWLRTLDSACEALSCSPGRPSGRRRRDVTADLMIRKGSHQDGQMKNGGSSEEMQIDNTRNIHTSYSNSQTE